MPSWPSSTPRDRRWFTSTYLGGSGDDFAGGIAVDKRGQRLPRGQNRLDQLPDDESFAGQTNGGKDDAFVAKLNPRGIGLGLPPHIWAAAGLRTTKAMGGDSRWDRRGPTFTSPAIPPQANFPHHAPGVIEGDPALTAANILKPYVTKLNPTGSALVYLDLSSWTDL